MPSIALLDSWEHPSAPRSLHGPLGCLVLFCGCERARILFEPVKEGNE